MRQGFLTPVTLALLVSAALPGAPSNPLAGFNTETGQYHFQHYGPKTYRALPQNWASAIDSRGILYFGNSSGVLQFDGSTWRLIPITDGSLVRSLTIGPDGLLYTGGSKQLGFLNPDANGVLTYTSLVEKLPAADRTFRDVWRTFTVGDSVWFGSDVWLVRYRHGSMRVWHPAAKFGKAFALNDSVYVNDRDNGLFRIENDNLVPVAGGAAVAKADVYGATVFNGESLIGAGDKLYRLTASGLVPFPTAADKFLAENRIYTLAVFPSQELAVGTRSGGIVLLAPDGSIDRIVGHNEGLPDNFVGSILPDRQGGYWLTQNTGITRLPPGLTTFGESAGLSADTFCLARAGGTLYAGTNSGIFRLSSSKGTLPHFEKVGGLTESVFMLLARGNSVLPATSHGIYETSGGDARPVLATAGPVYYLASSFRDPSRVFAAGRDAVMVLKNDGSAWSRVAEAAPAGEVFRSVGEDPDGTVWASTPRTIWHFNFSTSPAAASKYSTGAASHADASVIRLRNRIVFGTGRGLMKYSPQFRRLVPDSSLGTEFADGTRDIYSIWESPGGDVWATGSRWHGVFRTVNGERQWTPMPLLASEIRQIYDLQADADGVVWACGEDQRVFRWDPSLTGDPNHGFRSLARQISSSTGKSTLTLYGGDGDVPAIDLSYRNNALTFNFAAPFYETPASVEYQYQLEGVDKEWSRWTSEAKVPYQNLWEGSYRFHLRARNPHGVVTEELDTPIQISPPLYRSLWAYAIYAVGAVFLVWGIVRLRTRELEKEKIRLEGIVEERTVEIRKQRDEIHVQERKSHSLLLNILPEKVADELKSTGSVKPVGFEDVTVCFTDFVGFTLSSEKMPPAHLVDALNEYFTAFDEIIARYGLEKLKTIGDAYMFVSGLPERRASHAVDAVLAAMEMVQVVRRLKEKSGSTGWNIRVGLHSGPVVAGVVGIRKFAFDIWGNTVNFAARMESSGVPGSVNMSERTCRLTRGLIVCEGRGNVKIKEGRELLMFLAQSVSDNFAERYRQEFGVAARAIPQSALLGEQLTLKSAS